MKKQYQKTIIPLCDYKSNKTREELFSAYRMGVNAHPDHIRNNCDLWRERWIKEIDRRFIKNNIVLIKGHQVRESLHWHIGILLIHIQN